MLPKRLIVLAAAAGIVVLGLVLIFRSRRPVPHAAAVAAGPPWTRPEESRFIGREACAKCHEKEDARWAPSDHALAMQPMNEKTVLANFDGTSFDYHGVVSTFTRKDGKYFVKTDGPDGKLTDYEIAWAFGYKPLQQFLIRFPGGRVQALNVCWDTWPKEKGGQRWFHLYPEESVPAGDVLHWTGLYQNWNFMCAECHSTNVKKGYDAKTDTYATTFSEINVSCEACHGPGSAHAAWGEAEKRKEVRTDDPANGVLAGRKDRDGADWVFAPGEAIARRTVPRTNRDEVTMCARCHARRSVVHDPYTWGRPFLDTHRPSLLTDPLYFADGQIRDEVYEYASFLQSRMYAAGVTCTECHDAHSMKVRVSTDGVCTRCHLPEKYAERSHHFHKTTGTGASCVGCHMAARTYMVVDPRRDHSFRSPRPDLTLKIGTPNACTTPCHEKKSVAWAAEWAAKWWPKSAKTPHWGEAIHAGRQVLAGARPALVAVSEDRTKPGIVRATAVSMLGGFPGKDADQAIDAALSDAEPLIRMGAVASARGGNPRALLERLYPLLNDPVRTVRIDAARALAAVPAEYLSAVQRSAIQSGLAEWRAAQRVDEDRPEAHLTLGALDAELGELASAESEYKTALKLAPGFPATYVNLADLYRQSGRDAEGEKVLLEGLRITPKSADLHHTLGLLYIRMKKTPESLVELARAAELRPDAGRYAYVWGVALYSAGQPDKAMSVLRSAWERHTGDPEILLALASYSRERGDRAAALDWARKLVQLSPDDPAARQLLAQLARGR
ncbi:MAG TPA: tetratricopeptide repeat protein [Thermoanaerobaculia bacterium]|nr:tetratricopeptide repeat protein [Thermoanaerobaculia bacterium]